MASKTASRSSILTDGVKVNSLGFQVMSKVVLFRRPLQHSTVLKPEAPKLILLFGFMNAPLHTLQKDYISKYTEKWPSAAILVIRAFTPWLVLPQCERDHRLMPAVELILEETYEHMRYKDSPNGLLVHMFSNGGGFMFTSFTDLLERVLNSRIRGAEAWRYGLVNRTIQRDALEPLAIILDSVPTHAGILQRGEGFVTSFKTPFMRSVAAIPAAIALTTLMAFCYLLRSRLSFYTMNARLLSKNIIPGLSDYSTLRLYIYSEADEVVVWRDVEAHLRQLREVSDADQRRRSVGGFDENSDPIYVEKYGLDSRHILHVRTDAGRYWAAVDRVWDEALRRAASVKSRAKL